MRYLIGLMGLIGVLGAEEVQLRTGNWLVDQTRSVDLSDFDYSYKISSVARNTYLGCNLIEFDDGSLWKLAPMSEESMSFYEQLEEPIEVPVDHEQWAKEQTLEWERGDRVVLHKIAAKSLLVYNEPKNQLFNVEPYAPSLVGLEIVKRVDRLKGVLGFKLELSDGSVWKARGTSAFWNREHFCANKPVAMAKNTPFAKSLPIDVMKQQAHLVNMYPHKTSDGKDHFYEIALSRVEEEEGE